MNAFIKMTWTELKLNLREPVGAFFTLAFPVLLLVLFGGIYGNEPSEFFGGFGTVDVSVPGYIGMIIGTVGMIGIPITISNYREQGILRRYRATPIKPGVILWSQVAVNVLMALLGILILIIAGRLLYDLRFPAGPWGILPAIIIGSLGFFSLGFVLASVLGTPRTAQAVGMALFYPMLFLSGAALPRQIMPETIQRIAEFLPLTHVVILLEDLWFDNSWNLVSTAVILAMFAICLFVTRRTFKWE
ncbi:MAG: ABC transporter permease [Chloroflexota bacterium]